MPLTEDDRARKARQVVKHTCDLLGMTYAEYARQEHIDPQHLISFQAGGATLEDHELEKISLCSGELQEGLNWDVWEAKRKGLTPPKTLLDAWQEG
jgi:hypothetical protein